MKTGEQVRDTLSFIKKLSGKEIVELENAIDEALGNICQTSQPVGMDYPPFISTGRYIDLEANEYKTYFEVVLKCDTKTKAEEILQHITP